MLEIVINMLFVPIKRPYIIRFIQNPMFSKNGFTELTFYAFLTLTKRLRPATICGFKRTDKINKTKLQGNWHSDHQSKVIGQKRVFGYIDPFCLFGTNLWDKTEWDLTKMIQKSCPFNSHSWKLNISKFRKKLLVWN